MTKLFLIIIGLVLFFSPIASARIDSLVVFETIPAGTLLENWEYDERSVWTETNISGRWMMNCTGTNHGYAYNNSTCGWRWYQTSIASVSSYDVGAGYMMMFDPDDWYYAIAYYYTSPFPPFDSGVYLYHANETECFFWNGTAYVESDETIHNFASEEWQEIDTKEGVRMKAIWNFNDTWATNITIRFKLWEVDDDEPFDWLVDTRVPLRVPAMTFQPGVFFDFPDEEASGYTSGVMFWNLYWDTYEETGVPMIECPTFNLTTFMELYEDMNDLDFDDLLTNTLTIKNFLNTFDLISYYEPRINTTENQEDNIYVFSQMLTDFSQYYLEEEDPDYEGEIPDNVLWLDFFCAPETEVNIADILMIRIDTDNNGVYDDYDYTLIFWHDELVILNGSTEIDDDVNWWGTHDKTTHSAPVKSIFRDYNYTRYQILLNWDMFYNGSSGERIHTDLCRMSFNLVDADTHTFSILQDWNVSDDKNPKPASDDYEEVEYGNPSLWLYFQVNESISGFAMADPEDPPPVTEDPPEEEEEDEERSGRGIPWTETSTPPGTGNGDPIYPERSLIGVYFMIAAVIFVVILLYAVKRFGENE